MHNVINVKFICICYEERQKKMMPNLELRTTIISQCDGKNSCELQFFSSRNADSTTANCRPLTKVRSILDSMHVTLYV